jgi:spermidine synthase
LFGGFVLLPTIGASAASTLTGLVAAALGLTWARGKRMWAFVSVVAAVGCGIAALRHGGGARERVQGLSSSDFSDVAFLDEGPESTVWVARDRGSDARVLVIDGFRAAGEGPGTEYMSWMGHVPALATRPPHDALVICFGTGQTAHAVRMHRPKNLTIVDVNPAVFEAAPLFALNHAVLDDPSVRAVVMDGRAFLRRQPKARFDVITLEPMPPNHAGVNNLYSREFYALILAHLQPGGSVAQWLPLHLIAPEHMRAIIGTFVQAFPYARLWIDPEGTGILVAALQPWSLRTTDLPLPLAASAIAGRFLLDPEALRALSAGYPLVTDDNQLLSYGLQRLSRSSGRGVEWSSELAAENRRVLETYARKVLPRR